MYYVLDQSEPVSVATRTAISVPPVILISSLSPVQALPPLPTPLSAPRPENMKQVKVCFVFNLESESELQTLMYRNCKVNCINVAWKVN